MPESSDVIELARSLIRIPSYVNDDANEVELADHLADQLAEIGFAEVERRPLPGSSRYNVVALSEGATEHCSLLLAGHMDTVSEKSGWDVNPYEGIITGDRLYGLGAADMKGGIAAVLSALRGTRVPNGLCVLFYCDEEYDFSGMKSFLTTWDRRAPDMCLIGEPTDLKIFSECRGVIEILIRVAGKTGHSSRPHEGNNAITGLAEVLLSLNSWLCTFSEEPLLGLPTFNIARMRGGALRPDAVLTSAASLRDFAPGSNNIADYAEALIEVRPTNLELNAEVIINRMADDLEQRNLRLLEATSGLDVGALRTPRSSLSQLETIVTRHLGDAPYRDARSAGYTDGQLLQKAFLERDHVSVPVACFGPGGSNWHGPNEWVSIESLKTLVGIYRGVINELTNDR
jgi:succinyl-diaminopimelate desuccinylase